MCPKVSIIVPIYNIQYYVRRCLQSLMNQTYKNIEIIAVDDGSKDESSTIIDEIATEDARVKVIHKENRGLSSARNEGLKIVTGDYVLFVDGDDYLDDDAVEKLVQTALERHASVVLFPYVREYSSKSKKTELFNMPYKTLSLDQSRDYILAYLIGPGKNQKQYNPTTMERLNTAWGKLYRRKSIEGIEFIDTSIIGIEDGLYNIDVFSRLSDPVCYTKEVWYHYEKGNTTSLLHTYKNNYFEKRWNFYNRVQEIIKNRNLDGLEINLNNRIILELFGECLNIACNGKSISDQANYLSKEYTKYRYSKLINSFDFTKLNLIWKIYFSMLKQEKYYEVMLLTNLIMKIKR